jgi:hypothetical protein
LLGRKHSCRLHHHATPGVAPNFHHLPGRFQKGRSGNPGGKPKAGYSFLQEIRKYEPQAIEVLRRAMQCEKGGRPDQVAIRAAELLVAYSRGRPAQTQNVRVIRSIEDLSTEELELLLGEKDTSDGSRTTH